MPKIYSGEWLSAICVTDEFAGVDPVSTSTRAVYDAAKDEYVLNGTKTWVTNGSDCALFTVFANVTAEEHAVNPLTAFLVERNCRGIVISMHVIITRKIQFNSFTCFKCIKISKNKNHNGEINHRGQRAKGAGKGWNERVRYGDGHF